MQPPTFQRQLIAGLVLTVGLAGGCADEAVESRDICGETGAFKLLDLDETEHLLPARSISRIEDRYYITVGHGMLPVDSFRPWPGYERTTTYSVGPCGEEPRIVAEELESSPFTFSRWPSVPLGCQGEALDLVRIDPKGVSDPQLLLAGGCDRFKHTPQGTVLRRTVGDYDQRLLFHRTGVGDEPAFAPEVELFAAVRDWQILTDEVFGLRDSGELLRVSLDDLGVTLVATDVQKFTASADHILYSVGGVEPAVVLRDRNTADEVHLEFAASPIHRLSILDGAGIITVNEVDNTLVSLDDGEVDPLPAERRPVRLTADGRWLMYTRESIPVLYDLESSDEVVVSAREGQRWLDTEMLRVLEVSTSDHRESGALWQVPFDGGPERLLAHRASMGVHWLSDGRIVTAVDVDEAWLGDLILVEPDTLDELRIAGPVFHFSALQRREEGLDPEVLTYQVIDGERTGIYLMDLGV